MNDDAGRDTTPDATQDVITAPELAGLDGIGHSFFTRNGGVSEGIYASLNCGFGSDDAPDRVAENRRRAAAVLDVAPAALVTPYQVHGMRALKVTDSWQPGSAPEADAVVTARSGLALGILTADCAPILLADPVAGVIGAAHAGWRGALAGIVETTVAAMEALGATRGGIAAAIGPCIGRDSYEVGPEFPAPFVARGSEIQGVFSPARRPGHFLFDLGGYVSRELERAGIGAVGRIALDSCADESLLFSYRRATLRGEPDFGRGLSAITRAG
jgi:YfiH family protein